MSCPVDYTCPIIDKVIAFINEAKSKMVNYDALADLIGDEGNAVIELMEEIRSANGDIRAWGEEQEKRADDAEEQVSDLKNEVDELSDEITSLEKDIADCNKELEDLTEELDNVKSAEGI